MYLDSSKWGILIENLDIFHKEWVECGNIKEFVSTQSCMMLNDTFIVEGNSVCDNINMLHGKPEYVNFNEIFYVNAYSIQSTLDVSPVF